MKKLTTLQMKDTIEICALYKVQHDMYVYDEPTFARSSAFIRKKSSLLIVNKTFDYSFVEGKESVWTCLTNDSKIVYVPSKMIVSWCVMVSK